VALFIVVATAGALFGSGIVLETAGQAAEALRPVAGDLSGALFALGLFGASVLAATILPISTAYVICEAFGWESGVGKPFRDAPAFFVIYSFVLFAGAAVMLLPGLDLIGLIVASQNLQGLLLPVVLIFMLLLVNDRRLLGRHVNGRWRNVLAVGSIGVVVILDVALLGAGLLGAVGVDLG
jgi:Mn2+/Fe2+ NRAMP family transporter